MGLIETILALAFGIATVFFAGMRTGASKEKDKRNADELKSLEKGRKAVRDGRASGKSPDERVRRNDGMW